MGYSASEGVGIIFAVLATALNLLGGGIGIALYVLDSLGLYSIAKRRKIYMVFIIGCDEKRTV